MKIFIILLLTLSINAKINLSNNFITNFTQIVKNSKGKTLHYNGIFKFKKPDIVKWEYEKPSKKEICIKGLNIVIIDHYLEQVTQLPIKDKISLIKILRKAKKIKKNKYLSIFEDIKYIFFTKNEKINKVIYKDSFNNDVIIKFNNMKYDSISEKDFLCKIPQGYDNY